MCQLQYDAREVVPVMRCLNLTSVVSTWFSAVLDDSHAAAMCVPALSVAGGESFDTPDCPGLFDSQAYATSCNGGCRGLWQMSGSTVGYPNDDDPLKQAQLVYSLYTSDNIDYGCLAPWRSATPIPDIGQDASIMEHHVFCREAWTGAGDHYLTMGLNRIGGLSTDTSACSAAVPTAPDPAPTPAPTCAFVGFHASVSHPGDFALVLIADLPAGTELFVTDNGVDAGALETGESTLVFSNQGADTVAGTVLTASDFTGTLSDLSYLGDQVLAYTGDSDAPTFRCALNVEGSRWQTIVSNTRESELPPGL